ncbi:auxin response factor 18 [Cucurbita maxima]|uniref:Auxin response factor n=1 Tax=Cucurbita maxima TaxID=3661 RepID=A0A6J1JDX5_CUCMA|nr:auxin response factor 18 [Cucurbita maxima]
MKEAEKSLDPQLWHACAGGMVQMPAINSKVFYFPQGHAEHAQATVDFTSSLRIPPLILCRVLAVKFLADPETDEVFANVSLVPLANNDLNFEEEGGFGGNGSDNNMEKPASFAKTLTQSDANNGGGFSVPRYCAETIFPRLDYTADPPVQTVIAMDVHGVVWKFRHIYRGTPRRHLLTTGWSSFVNQKKLVAGDSIVFLRSKHGDLCVGIRRAKRAIGCAADHPYGWNPGGGNCFPPCGGLTMFLRDEDNNKLSRKGSVSSSGGGGNLRGKGKVRPESVIEAAALAASGQPFEVVYYPRASTPEFCVKASSVRAAMRIQWCSGMRFKMPFETEDSSRISWFMGTTSSVQVADPIRWPNSPWRLLQVTWDEPDLLQNVKRVSPWLVELVSNMPVIQLSPFSSPRKKFRLPQIPDIPLDSQFPLSSSSSSFSSNTLRPSSPMCCLSDNTSVGIQGARHTHFGISLSDFHLNNKLQLGLVPSSFQQLHFHSRISNTDHTRSSSALLNGEKTGPKLERSDSVKKKHQFLLFGQPILTEQQICCSSSSDIHQVSPNKSDTELGLDIGHCKVFMESEDVGRTLNLSVISSYEELYRRLAYMFGMEKPDILSHVLYQDATGAVKQAGDKPFSDFIKTARRLTILTDESGSDKMGRRTLMDGVLSGENGRLDASNKTGPLSILA